MRFSKQNKENIKQVSSFKLEHAYNYIFLNRLVGMECTYQES